MHTLGHQEMEVCPCDSGFETRRIKSVYNVTQVLQDFIEQLERSFGAAYDSFLHYVQSCDSRRCLNMSTCDMTVAKITSNDRLEQMIEEIFITFFLTGALV